MAGAKIALTSNTGELRTDGYDNARVNLPTTAIHAGFARQNYLRDAATSREAQISYEGGVASEGGMLLHYSNFNGAAAGALMNNQFNVQTTTMTAVLNAGFLRFNGGAITTLNTGAAIFTHRTFNVQSKCVVSASAHIRHTQGAISNKQFEFGFGYYDIAANQAATMNEFAGFRWTQAGALIGVLEYSAGGTPTTITVNLNSGIPYADSVTRRYEVKLSQELVEFWVEGAYVGQIVRQPDAPGAFKGNGYPVIARLFNGASAPALAPVFDINNITVIRFGYEADIAHPIRQSLMGRHCSVGQAGLTATLGNTANRPASGTAPTAVTANNTTTAAITGLGGYFRLNGASIVAAEHTEYIISSYQNPVLPETVGSALDGRSLIITDVMISPVVVSTLLAGGGATFGWFLAHGHNTISLASVDAAGTTVLGTISPRITPLPITDTFAAAAAVGTILTRNGQSAISLATPIVVHPGQFFQVGIRTRSVAALVSAGVLDGHIGISGYWE
jgi:hypothetical protein